MKQKVKTMIINLLKVEHVGSVNVEERKIFKTDNVENRKPKINVWSQMITHRFSAKELRKYITEIQEIVGLDFDKSYTGSRGLPAINYRAGCPDFEMIVFTHLNGMNAINEIAGCELTVKEHKYTNSSFSCKVREQ